MASSPLPPVPAPSDTGSGPISVNIGFDILSFPIDATIRNAKALFSARHPEYPVDTLVFMDSKKVPYNDDLPLSQLSQNTNLLSIFMSFTQSPSSGPFKDANPSDIVIAPSVCIPPPALPPPASSPLPPLPVSPVLPPTPPA